MTQTRNIRILASHIITVKPESGLLVELHDSTIRISKKSGRILSVENTTVEDTKELDEDTIDLRGKTILPGFIDTHVHCEASTPKVNISLTPTSLSTPI